jgi:hypothetical protein
MEETYRFTVRGTIPGGLAFGRIVSAFADRRLAKRVRRQHSDAGRQLA